MKKEHPDWETKNKSKDENPFIEGDLPEMYAKLGI